MAAKSVALAEALLRRKELNEYVVRTAQLRQKDLFEIKVTRKAAHEGIDDVIAQVPKLTMEQVMAAYDTMASRLRRVDAAIQKANWNTIIELDADIFDDYKEKA